MPDPIFKPIGKRTVTSHLGLGCKARGSFEKVQ